MVPETPGHLLKRRVSALPQRIMGARDAEAAFSRVLASRNSPRRSRRRRNGRRAASVGDQARGTTNARRPLPRTKPRHCSAGPAKEVVAPLGCRGFARSPCRHRRHSRRPRRHTIPQHSATPPIRSPVKNFDNGPYRPDGRHVGRSTHSTTKAVSPPRAFLLGGRPPTRPA